MFKKISKKYFFLFSALLALFFLSVPVMQPAQAGLGSIILNLLGVLTPAMTLSISAILHLFLLISQAGLIIMSGVMEWTLGNPFTYSLTNPASNPVINVGWTLLRDLTNMGFVVGLAYIGLATALNIGGFQTKKTFGRFIVAALLINFTPVICGVIVDASNILMTFFTKEIGTNFNQFANLYGSTFSSAAVLEFLENSITTVGIMKLSLALALNVMTTIILFVFSFLFLARNVAIWLLVIISPIAFFCWIFDSTRNVFQKWWGQFLNWSFIGVLAGFALYLSAHLLNAFQKGGLSTNSTAIFDEGANLFVPLAPFIIVIIFMNFAFLQVMKTSASGGNLAISAAKFSGQQLGSASKKAGMYGLKKTRNLGIKAEEKMAQSPSGFWKAVGGATSWATGRGEAEGTRSGWSKATRAVLGLGGGGVLAMGARNLLARASEAGESEINKTSKKFAGKSLETQEAALKNAKTLGSKLGILNQMVEDGNYAFSDYAQKELANVLKGGVKNNPLMVLKSLRFVDPETTMKISQELEGKVPTKNLQNAGMYWDPIKDPKEGYKNLEEKLIATMKPAKMELWSADTAKKYAGEKSDVINKFWTGAHISKGAELFGRTFVEEFKKGIADKDKQWYVDNKNISLARWRTTTGAATLGVQGFEGSDEDLKKFFNAQQKGSVERGLSGEKALEATAFNKKLATLDAMRREKEAEKAKHEAIIKVLETRKATGSQDDAILDKIDAQIKSEQEAIGQAEKQINLYREAYKGRREAYPERRRTLAEQVRRIPIDKQGPTIKEERKAKERLAFEASRQAKQQRRDAPDTGSKTDEPNPGGTSDTGAGI